MANALSSFMPDQRKQSLGVDGYAQQIDAFPLNKTAPAPAPAPRAMPNALAAPNAYMGAPKKPQNEMLGAAVRGFQRGFDPAGFEKQREDAKTAGQDKAKQTLALMQQQRQLPEEQRTQWWQQNAGTIGQIIGQDISQQQVDPAQFSDQALDGQIAALSGQLGISPKEAEFLNLGGGNVGKVVNGKFSMERAAPTEAEQPFKMGPGDVMVSREDKDGDGELDVIFKVPDNDPEKQASWQRVVGDDGVVYAFNPQTRETRVVMGPNGQPLRSKESSGVTINMPGNVREGVDPATGQPVFIGIDPKNPDAGFQTIAGAAPPSNMMGAETRSKFMALAPNAYAGIGQLRELFKDDKNPLAGAGTAAELANAVPFVGDIAARAIGGQTWQDFDQAWNAIELGVHIPAGAAVSVSEAQRFLRANKPALGETKETTKNKLDNVERFYQGLEAGFRGDWTGLKRLMGASTAPKASAGGGGAAQLDDEEQALVAELRRAGKTPAEINAILSGQ